MTFEERYASAYQHGLEDGQREGKIPLWATLTVFILGVAAGFIGGVLLAHL